MSHWTTALEKLHACQEAVDWSKTQPNFPTAWKKCKRGDWLLWLAGAMAGKDGWPELKQVVLAGIACGRLSLKHAGQYRQKLAEVFDVAERCANHPTPENISAAWSAVRSAAWSADAAESAAWSARSAAYAAADAYAAAYAAADAYAAAYAAYAAAYAAYAANSAARSSAHKAMCDIIRKRIKPGKL